jgi:glutamate-1-semialdehyde 2,1-aminomutase
MILAILQARVSSTRLPGKCLKPILGKPLLQHQIERTRRSRRIDKLLLATSTDPSDDPLAQLCERLDLPCYRGDLNDVLDRYYRAALPFHPDHVVRLTGDCPLIDPVLADQLIAFYLTGKYDYAANCLEPTFPDGLDAEIFSFGALREAWEAATLPSEREHVTPYIRRHADRFRIGSFTGDQDLSSHRWTVDEPRDLAFVARIYEGLYEKDPFFTTGDILEFLGRNPEIREINQDIVRNAGYEKSLAADKRALAVRKLNIAASMDLQEHAKERIPGLSQLLSKRPDLYSYGVWPGYFEKAKGAAVWDLDGNRYVDMSIGGVGAAVLGYADPDVDEAVKAAIDRGSCSSLNCPEEVALADLLCELHPWAQKVRFARSGGESMAVAVRIARAWSGRDNVAFCGYHGWHDWYLAANLGTENALGEHLISGLDPAGVPKGLTGTAFPFRYNRTDELEKILAGNRGRIAAIVMEPIRNEEPEPGFFAAVKELAREHGAVWIVDEISAGFRMNTGGAHLLMGLEPDMAVFSKALGNGYPIAAIIGKAWVMEAAQKTFISSTCWTERIGPVAAIATIRKHRALAVADHLMHIGRLVQEGWRRLSSKHDLPLQVGGIPPLSHFAFAGNEPLVLKALFIQGMLERGFLATTGFYSMYAHSEEQVRAYLAAADEVFGIIKEALETGAPEHYLIGEPAVAGFRRLN